MRVWHSSGLNGIQKADVSVPNTPQIQHILVCPQEQREAQLHTREVSEITKALGFALYL